MFTKRHEQELAEIKALTYELGQDFKEVLARLDRIEAAQMPSAAQVPAATVTEANQGAVKARRKAARATAQGADSAPGVEPVNPKKARRRSAAVAADGGGKPGKARRAAEGGSPETGVSEGRTRKRRDPAARKPAKREPVPSSSADEE